VVDILDGLLGFDKRQNGDDLVFGKLSFMHGDLH
jgi:hypothetical protein